MRRVRVTTVAEVVNITSVCFYCCLSYPARAELYCHLWPVRLYRIFSTLSHKWNDFRGVGVGEGGELLNTKCVFWVSLQRLSETFHIQITILRELSHLYTGLHVMHPLFLSDFKCTRAFLDKFSDDPRIKNFVKIGPVWAELCHADKHDEGNSRSSQISPEWVTGPEQGNPSGRIATFSLWTGMFRDDLGSVSSPLCVWNLKNCM